MAPILEQLKKPYEGFTSQGSSYELRDVNETTSLQSTLPADYFTPPKRMSGRFSNIAWNSCMLTIPMLLMVAFLIALVLRYQVQPNGVLFPTLRLPEWDQQDERFVYYVRISSTILVFIASWSSTLAPTLAGFALALMAYPAAASYSRAGKAEKTNGLMTPYQLFLTLNFLDGAIIKSVWSWLRYVIGWRRHRERQPQPLTVTVFVAILALFLGVVIFASDTWLHVTTNTVGFIQINPLEGEIDYSFGLLPDCATASNYSYRAIDQSKVNIQCSVNIGGTNVFFVNASQSLQVLNNVSDSMAVLTYQYPVDTAYHPYTYLGVPTSDTLSQRDYTAKTYGMETQCIPMSTACNLSAPVGASTPFHCSDAFHGDLTQDQNGFDMAYFTDSSMNSNNTLFGVNNPYFFGVAAAVNQQAEAMSGSLNSSFPEIIVPMHGGVSFVLNCSTTLFDIEYDSVNGTVARFVTKPSNDSVANIWEVANEVVGEFFVETNLLQAASLAVFSENAQELADKIALAYSRTALAIGAQAVAPMPALAAQERESFLVSKVHAAPLYTLLVANLLFVVMGVVLTVLASFNSRSEVREVQARLSLAGLVADRFETARETIGIEHIHEKFEEFDGRGSKRVGIDYVQGSGYSYRVWNM